MNNILVASLVGALLVSCAQPLKRQAHFLPVFEGRVLLSGKVRFIESSQLVAYSTPEIERLPKCLSVTRLPDNSVLVTWVTTNLKPEKLLFIDNGVHPVQVPEIAIQETKELDAQLPLFEPFLLDGFGETTAFAMEFIQLGGRVN